MLENGGVVAAGHGSVEIRMRPPVPLQHERGYENARCRARIDAAKGAVGRTALFGMAGLFMVGMLALGLLLSMLARTQAQAMQLGLMTIVPTFLLSGFMFPLAAMPPVAQWAGALLPATHFVVALRGILLKRAGLGALWHEAAIMAALAAALLVMAAHRFARMLE